MNYIFSKPKILFLFSRLKKLTKNLLAITGVILLLFEICFLLLHLELKVLKNLSPNV